MQSVCRIHNRFSLKYSMGIGHNHHFDFSATVMRCLCGLISPPITPSVVLVKDGHGIFVVRNNDFMYVDLT